MKTFLTMIVGISLSIFCFLAQAESVLISPKEASILNSEKKAVIVDVREDDEWKDQHIAGAIHIPLDQLQARLPELQAYKDTTVIAQCKSGRRSLKALEIIQAAGFTKAVSMDGGLNAWTEQGLAVTK